MIVLTTTANQSLSTGQAIVFDRTLLKHGCGITHRANSGAVHLNSNRAYQIDFHGNLSNNASALELTIYDSGVPLNETVMKVVPASTGDSMNVSAGTIIGPTSCPCDKTGHTITVVNTSTNNFDVDAGAVLIIKEV